MFIHLSAVWIFFSAWCVLGGQLLSLFGILNQFGNSILLASGLILSAFVYYLLNGSQWRRNGLRWRRFKKPFPLLFFFCFAAALVGGALHAPSNYDGFCYRIPRMLHWLDVGRWHWIGGFLGRMDYSSLGFEWLMLPPLATFKTFRLAFLINVFSFLLLPSLIFATFRSFGVRNSVAATWMWILPCGSCFALQAGSIGNDLLAVDYVLIAVLFAKKTIDSGRLSFLWIATLATGLMTGAKASNLPLLLPVAILAVPLFYHRPRLIMPAIPACLVALLVSFAPLAYANWHFTGDWTGDPRSKLKLNSPLAGLEGNALQLVTASLTPAVFPPASSWNRMTANALTRDPLLKVKQEFPKLMLDVKEMASEEGAGLGLGVSVALVLGALAAIFIVRRMPKYSLGLLVTLGFWAALIFYMIKLGNESGPRLLAPYYPCLLLLPLLLPGQKQLVRAQWWKWISLLLLLPIVPALLFNPARPLIPVDHVIEGLRGKGTVNGIVKRMESVYGVYAGRSDAHAKVRALLPAGTQVIGFGGTGDDSEVSFWLPLGERKVRDFTPLKDGSIPDPSGLDVIVTSDWGCGDRFNTTPEELAASLGWKIFASTSVPGYASTGPRTWSILVPK